MRVIAGKARRIILETVPGFGTRPTTDRIKETLFNILQPYLVDCLFLDLFSGSGAIGIEALSRGATSCVFVEKNPQAIRCIDKNLERTRLKKQAIVLQMDVEKGIQRAGFLGKQFDIIFMDPPYRMGLEKKALVCLAQSGVLAANALIVVEAALETHLEDVTDLGFEVVRIKQYKTNQHIFLYYQGVSKP